MECLGYCLSLTRSPTMTVSLVCQVFRTVNFTKTLEYWMHLECWGWGQVDKTGNVFPQSKYKGTLCLETKDKKEMIIKDFFFAVLPCSNIRNQIHHKHTMLFLNINYKKALINWEIISMLYLMENLSKIYIKSSEKH